MNSEDNIIRQLIIDEMAELNEKNVIKYVKQALGEGLTEKDISSSLKKGMEIVGNNFASGEYFVTDLIMAGMIFKEVFELIGYSPEEDTSRSFLGTVILATVEGDIHDIGKDIVSSLAESAGFKVIDLGVDVPAATIIHSIKTNHPDILGLSGVMSFAQAQMKDIVNLLEVSNLRDDLKIAAGGATFSNNAIDLKIGADLYSTDAWDTVEKFKEWVKNDKQ